MPQILDQNSAQNNLIMAPTGLEIGALALATVVALLLYNFEAYDVLNVVSPILLTVVIGSGTWSLITRLPAAVWSSIFAARLAAIAFLGIGSLMPYVLDEFSRDYMYSLYPYTDLEAAKVNLMFIVGMLLLLGTVKVTSMLWSAPATKIAPIQFSELSTLKLGVLFFAIGTAYTLLIDLPIQLGARSIVIPGSIAQAFSALSAVGAFMIALWGFRRKGTGYFAVLIPLVVAMVLSIIALSKTTFMLPLLMVSIAFLMTGISWRRVALLVFVFSATLAITQPMINYGRLARSATYGQEPGGNIGERIGYAVGYWRGEPIRAVTPDDPNSFIRLNYLSPATFIVTQYDNGQPSDVIQNGFSALVPRAIWPDKPIISSLGSDLYTMITGNVGSALGATLFADLYWNFGWLGLLLIIPIGVYFWWASCVSRVIVQAGDWLTMPFVFLAFLIGTSLDSSFVLSFFAPIVSSLIGYVGLKFISSIVSEQMRRSKASATTTPPVLPPLA